MTDIEAQIEAAVTKVLKDLLDKSYFPPILKDVDVARMCSCSVDWLRDLRSKGEGPPVLRVAKKAVRYDRDAVLEWFRQHASDA